MLPCWTQAPWAPNRGRGDLVLAPGLQTPPPPGPLMCSLKPVPWNPQGCRGNGEGQLPALLLPASTNPPFQSPFAKHFVSFIDISGERLYLTIGIRECLSLNFRRTFQMFPRTPASVTFGDSRTTAPGGWWEARPRNVRAAVGPSPGLREPAPWAHGSPPRKQDPCARGSIPVASVQ